MEAHDTVADVNPVHLDDCEDILPQARMCSTLRFTQMVLLKPIKIKADTGKKRDLIPSGFLILQPRAVSIGSINTLGKEAIDQRVASFRQKIERAMPITSDIKAGRLPNPRDGLKAADKMKSALLAQGQVRRSLHNDEQVVRAYSSFVRKSVHQEARPIIRALSRFGSSFVADIDRIIDNIEKAIRDMLDPGPSQPIDSLQPHISLCAVFEQKWCHLGYTRGERVATIALAPGEEMTLEVHSWVKDTVKSERELIVESETRLTNKLTARDHLEVANELTTKGHFGSNAKIDLTIPVEGIPIGIGAGTDISADLSNTLQTTMQRTTEDTREAANSLSSTRKLRIEEARETGRDDKQLRRVVNTNRCHTLNVHYFEVLANHEITTSLVELRLCLLLPVTKPTVTPEWVLCHEHVLKNVLLDRVFLAGFDGAKTLVTQDQLSELEESAAGTTPGSGTVTIGGGDVEAEMGHLRDAILAAFDQLKDTLDDSQDALADLASINLFQLPWDVAADVLAALATLGSSMPRLMYWGLLEINTDTLSALNALENSTDRPALESLRNFFAAVTHRDYQYNIIPDTLAEAALLALGIPFGIVGVIMVGGFIVLVSDDADLHVAVKAAQNRLKQIEERAALTGAAEAAEDVFDVAAAGGEFTTELDGFTRLKLAEANVEFERLKCHILRNCDHYFHAVWALEQGCRALASLNGYELLVSPTPIGFVGMKAAYPLLDEKFIETYFDPASIKKAREDVEKNFNPPPVKIAMPTPGPIAEVTLGECEGCEDYVIGSRANDLRQRGALAAQEEAEAKRREDRLAAGELDPFDPCCTDKYLGSTEAPVGTTGGTGGGGNG